MALREILTREGALFLPNWAAGELRRPRAAFQDGRGRWGGGQGRWVQLVELLPLQRSVASRN